MPNGARRQIRLFPDFGREDWPLWEDENEDDYLTGPADYGLSPALTRDLSRWNSMFQNQFDSSLGWKTVATREEWRVLGEDIAQRLPTEVTAFADVSYEPWPLAPWPPR